MLNVIMFGTGTTANVVLTGLKENIHIICYCDNDRTKWGKIFKGKNVIPPNEIMKFNYDYIVIASQFNNEIYKQLLELGIDRTKIFQFFRYIDSIKNNVRIDIDRIVNSIGDIEGIITGISYVQKGIKATCMTKKFVKMARQSQDLFLDYNLVKYALTNYKEKLCNLKYVIIGLNYYSFEYDMSCSAMKDKVLSYYNVIGEKHHLYNIKEYLDDVNVNRKIALEILNLKQSGYPVVDWKVNKLYDLSEKTYDINDKNGKEQAELDGNKNYPETVKENIEILKKYLTLLNNNNIKAIIVVCPTSKYYFKYYPQRLKDEFNTIIEMIKKEYKFQYMNYFESDLFDDKDFYDVSHLNSDGANKFTKILNLNIQW
ncbi:MAG: chemotaxis protein [Clostridium neonatale]